MTRVDEARGSDADADQRPRGRRHQAVEKLVDRGERGVAVTRGDRQVERLADLSAQVHDRAAEAVLGEILSTDGFIEGRHVALG